MKIDNWLIDKIFQPLSDFFEDLTGQNNFFLARCLLVMHCLVWFFLSLLEDPKKILDKGLGMIMNFSTLLLILFLITKAEKGCRCIGSVVTANPFRGNTIALCVRMFLFFWFMFKIALIFLCFFLGIELKLKPWLILTMELCLLALIYFASCTPRPPQKDVAPWFSKSTT